MEDDWTTSGIPTTHGLSLPGDRPNPAPTRHRGFRLGSLNLEAWNLPATGQSLEQSPHSHKWPLLSESDKCGRARGPPEPD